MIRQKNITLTSTAVEVTFSDEVQSPNSMSVENTSPDKYVYIGNDSVTTASYGFKLYPAQTITIDMNPFDKLYACGDSGATIAVMVVEI